MIKIWFELLIKNLYCCRRKMFIVVCSVCFLFCSQSAIQDKKGTFLWKVLEICKCIYFSVQYLQDCTHQTIGPHCDSCQPGYYGNATGGSPADCQPCACPLSLPSNK